MTRPRDVTVVREIADGAQVSPDAVVGPFCVIGPHVAVGPGTVLGSRVTLTGRTTVGADNVIGEGSVLGSTPQDLKFLGRPTYLILGDRNRLAPKVTAHVGTENGGFLTRIGNDNVLEAGAHVAHDCYVDDRTHLGPCVLLAGHVRVETGAVIQEITGAHHFTTVGRYSLIASRTPVRRDVPPFTVFSSGGYYAESPSIRGVHEAGLDHAGLSGADRAAVRQAVEFLFRTEHDQAITVKLEQLFDDSRMPPPVRMLCEFCRQTAAGVFGRQREVFRGKIPPEARDHLPPEVFARAEGA